MVAPPNSKWKIPAAFKGMLAPPGQYRYKVYYGGRGGAKSESAAVATIAKSYQRKQLFLYFRETQVSLADSSMRTIANRIEELDLTQDFDIQTSCIINKHTRSEWAFYGIRDNPAKIKSFAGATIAIGEEANTLSERSFDILDPTIREECSEIWLLFNPDKPEDFVYQHFVVNEPPEGSLVVKVSYRDNPFFPAVLERQRLEMQKKNPKKYLHVWEGQTNQESEEIIFSGYTHIEDLTPQNIPAAVPTKDRTSIRAIDVPLGDHRSPLWTDLTLYPPTWDGPYFGCDFGFSNDPTVLTRIWIIHDTDPPTLYIEYEAYGYHLELDKTPTRFNMVPDAYRSLIRADSSRPESISYIARNGYPQITSVTKWPGSIEDGIEHMKAYKKIVIHPRCTLTANQFGLYSFKKDRAGNILATIIDKHNDAPDSIRYGIQPLIKSMSNQGLQDLLRLQAEARKRKR